MHSAKILMSIYKEHRYSVPLMVETLLDLEVPTEDALLLGTMPWEFPASRIAVERERLDLSPVHPLLDFKLTPPPPDWLTPAVIVKMFDLALYGPGDAPSEYEDEDDDFPGRTLILPA